MAMVRKTKIKSLNRKRHQYSIEYKLNAVAKWRELNENTSQAARHPEVNVDRQTLKGWILNEESYRCMSNKKVAKRLKKRTKNNTHPFKHGHIEKKLVQFIRADMPSPLCRGSSNQSYLGKETMTRRTRNAPATVTSVDSLSQPTAAKFLKKTGMQFENRQQKAMTHPVRPLLAPHAQMQMQQQQQHLQGVSLPLAPAQPATRKVRVLAPPVHVAVAQPKPVQKPRPREKQIFIVNDHQRCIMSNLASLWKSGKLCDAGIGNGLATVMVHKLVLYAVCPKLLSVFNTDTHSNEFLQVNFPRIISTEALNAFAEYMYNGVLDLDHDILEQLKIIAKRLKMKEFEELCNSHLPNPMHQPPATASYTNIPLIPTSMQFPSMTSSLPSLNSTISAPVQSAQAITTQVIDVKQELSEAELAQVKKETIDMFGQESEVASLTPNKSGNATSFVICPSIKTEPVGPEDDKYGHLSSNSNNQTFTSTIPSSSSSSLTAPVAASISTPSVPASQTEYAIPFSEIKDVISTHNNNETFLLAYPSSSSSSLTAPTTSNASVPASQTEFAIPLSETTDVKSIKLKTSHSYDSPLVSDLSPVSCIVETVCSQSSHINVDSSKKLSRSSLPSVDLPTTTTSNKEVYPVRLFSSKGDNLPLLLSPHLSNTMTLNSFTTDEKT